MTQPHPLQTNEPTIAAIHAAMKAGELTCRQLVQHYLNRIEAYDNQGPALNAIVLVNPRALGTADELDKHFANSGFVGPLHGIPIIVKDNYDTFDLPTTAGSLSLAGSIPPDDAFQVRKLREAGAIVLGKSNMAEFAFSPYQTVGSMLPGHTRNPYALNRTTAGSSGGTAAAVAANFGTVGLGTDTGNSIRGPSSHCCLVGIRSTMGLTSRDGIIPLYLGRDVGGPMARTVEDAVRIFDVLAGYDPADPVTAASKGKRAEAYIDFLDREGLEGARIGVARQLFSDETVDPRVVALLEQAVRDMVQQGAHIVDPVEIPDLSRLLADGASINTFHQDLNGYLASLGSDAPMKNLAEIVEARRYHPSISQSLKETLEESTPEEEAAHARIAKNVERLKEVVRATMDQAKVDTLIYPTWNNLPRLIGDLNTPHGNNSWKLSPPTGFPAITVPMGFVDGQLPAGLQFLGRAWSEPTLIKIVYAYEQSTQHRIPPASTPSLR
ncbi:MAG: amidase family protein [Chloroflexota bacterium]